MPSTVAPNVTLYQRTEMGWPATVYNSDGHTPRPKLVAPAHWKTVHYTGASVNYQDAGDFVKECQDLERYAVGAGKSNEYNWIIGADGPDKACIATYAGDYQAAHSSGENSQAIGILFMNGVGQPVTDAQVLAFQWLVADLAARGRTGPSTQTTPHKQMPEAATACPGDEVLKRWDELLAPYSPTPAPPPTNSNQDDLRTVLNEGAAYGSDGPDAWAETNRWILDGVRDANNQILYNGPSSLQYKLDDVLTRLDSMEAKINDLLDLLEEDDDGLLRSPVDATRSRPRTHREEATMSDTPTEPEGDEPAVEYTHSEDAPEPDDEPDQPEGD